MSFFEGGVSGSHHFGLVIRPWENQEALARADVDDYYVTLSCPKHSLFSWDRVTF